MSGISGWTLRVAWDTWRAERGGPAASNRLQRARLSELVEFARSASPYYRRLYRDVPDADELHEARLATPGAEPAAAATTDGVAEALNAVAARLEKIAQGL